MKETKLVRNTLTDLAPNNSNKYKNTKSKEKDSEAVEKQKLKPLVEKGKVIKKKRTLFDKFKESFLGESENLGDYIMHDVLIPAFRDTISDMGFGVIERLFGGGRVGGRGGRSQIVRDRGRSYVSYAGVQNDNRGGRRDLDSGSRRRHNFENVVFLNKWNAEDVLAGLVERILEYQAVTVRDFYELSNIESEWTDNDYGWVSLREAYVDRTRDGWIIVLPNPRPL